MVIRNHTRNSFRKSFGLLVFALAVLLMSWEGHRIDAAVVNGAIPEEAIRLRVLANSDSPQDQAIKRHVRDAIVEQMAGWAQGPQTIEQARLMIESRLPELEQTVGEVLETRGFTYGYKVELGVVPFPTKMYGKTVYPAGDYEALRITLGSGEGQNWWCVLFPPLCFVDGVSGEATVSAAAMESPDNSATGGTADAFEAPAPEVKFFIWELIQSVIDFFNDLF
ncbi:stage II sporulation protein R [Paenibacillus sp. GCM10012307]|uniref:Stage II sporulation protein R n=1 Tax=Paenibacillus roseus TaxID=2798579 RepID=A0A934MPA6_9BACL|nr:stage II sporulation protein R [Paenibacillus roseus]MBJ6361871.1 stage II sporulation protein R [Paenibacillus roseus]